MAAKVCELLTTVVNLLIIWISNLSDTIKQDFSGHVSTTLSMHHPNLKKWIERKLDGNYSIISYAVLENTVSSAPQNSSCVVIYLLSKKLSK